MALGQSISLVIKFPSAMDCKESTAHILSLSVILAAIARIVRTTDAWGNLKEKNGCLKLKALLYGEKKGLLHASRS